MTRAQIRVLDSSFSGGTGGAGSGFGFQLVGVTRTTNQAWFQSLATNFEVELEAKRALRRGGPETLNIYTIDGGPYLGFAYYPSILTYEAPCRVARSPSTARGTRPPMKSDTGSRCITRSKASAAGRTITCRTPRRNSLLRLPAP